MSYFPAKTPQGVFTLSNYVVFRSAAVTPAAGLVQIGITKDNLGSFIPTEAFVFCEAGPATANSDVRVQFSIGFTAPNYADFVVIADPTPPPYMLGGDGTSPQIALNIIAKKFKQLTLVATSGAAAAGYGAGTPRNTATGIQANITSVVGAVTSEQLRFVVGGFYTGLR